MYSHCAKGGWILGNTIDGTQAEFVRVPFADGVHGKPVSLQLQTLWSHNVTITTRLVDTATTPLPLKALVAGRLDPRRLITHQYQLGEMDAAYDTFANAAKEKALKVVLRSA